MVSRPFFTTVRMLLLPKVLLGNAIFFFFFLEDIGNAGTLRGSPDLERLELFVSL